MRFSKFWAILAPAVLLLALPASSFADQFNVDFLSNDNIGFVGLSSNGNAYFFYGPTGLYSTYTNGVLTANTSVAPTFTADNGTACSPSVPAGTYLVRGVCNNGYQAFSAGPASTTQGYLYSGSNQQLLFGPGSAPLPIFVGLLYMNNIGDIVFDDQANGKWYEAFDVTPAATPEPTSALLFATGLLTPFFFLRRRIASHTL